MAGRYRRPTTPEQREKAAQAQQVKLAALHDTLTEQVTALAAGPAWRRWLDVASKFHNYSFNNTVLLMAQKPDATQVGGYNLWQELGRQVIKGEKGLSILAPVTRRTEDGDGAAADPPAPPSAAGASTDGQQRPPRRVVGFRPAYVWDITQTSGDPLPAQPTPTLLAGHAPDGLWDALAAQCRDRGFTVDRRAIGGDDGPNGYTAYATHEVVVRSDVDDAQAVKTLAHELGHVLMHDPAGFQTGQTRGCRGEVEVEAESLAYLVAADHGLDTSSYTFAYVAGWAAQTGDVQNALRATGTRVLATAHTVLEHTHDHLANSTDTAAEAVSASAVDADTLTARVLAGADRTAALRPTPAPAAPDRDRLVAANHAAAAYYAGQYAGSWAPEYLQQRIGTSLADDRVRGIGYAPAGWTTLADHLRRGGFSDTEILDAGLGIRASTGKVVDRFRDRLMIPLHTRTDTASGGLEVIGFVGRRNPAQDDAAADARNPKYLNTAHTPIYTKGQHLYGLTENHAALDRGGLAVLVEGPIDALAVDHASGGMMAGISPLGTALTDVQAAQLAAALPAGSDGVVVATDADQAGEHAAAHAYQLLTANGLDPRAAALPAGMDPAQTAQQHGPAALVDRLATAEPMGRQLVARTLAGEDMTWVEQRFVAAKVAAAILAKAAPSTWEREVQAVSARTGVDVGMLRSAIADTLTADRDHIHRLTGRDQRDDLDRGQHVTATPAQFAARSAPRSTTIRPPGPIPLEEGRAVQRVASYTMGR